jgi:hypothetical protein
MPVFVRGLVLAYEPTKKSDSTVIQNQLYKRHLISEVLWFHFGTFQGLHGSAQCLSLVKIIDDTIIQKIMDAHLLKELDVVP